MGSGNISSAANPSSGLEAASRHIQTASIVIYCVIFIVGTLGNALVIYVTGFKMKKTVETVWFLNLAIADFLFTAFLIFAIISLSQGHRWPFGELMCQLNTFVTVVNMFASIFTLTAMSLDRYLSIWVVVWAHNKRTVCKARLICVGIWVIAVVCSTPYATFRTLVENHGAHYCGYPVTPEQKWSLHIFRFLMGFVIPFLVIFVSYVAIGIRTMRMSRTRRQRSRRIIFSIIFAFFICWLPLHVFNFIEIKAANNPDLWTIVRIMGPLTVSLAFLNSCLNPILYVFMCEEFMKKLRQSICFVLESALAEDHVSFLSTRSMSTFSSAAQKSDAAATSKRTDTANLKSYTESKVIDIDH
ncbi:C3a anaphylatoxin chemotactic receptor-like [Oreochromis aureus]|uniref:G-protein coupled receptors family 1 profile domain-containing protein n=1 Tax=Oreochromis aureus TaxID=47969 RepID=A0AAZ1XVS9_OREAU|nr:C3a anaphylatoxin chemotactic receptor-like [Oreochromis aureus]